ncbi:hypothetical protein KR074_012606 [Drosophila pseudoananassae]|nr:hypothetical protein KR074_012606 [Drosophila pseudoananassae]
MSFLPGEPLPPGYEEDDVARPAVIQKQIESYSGGALLGTDYAIELHEVGQPRPDYYCVLCQTCNDSRSIFVHWTSLAHRSKYLQTHFQKAYDVLQKLKRIPNSSGDLVIATGNLAQLIEKQFGRPRQVTTASNDDFRRNRDKILNQVRDKFHFDQSSGSDFVEQAQCVLRELKPDDPSIKINLKINEPEKREDGNIISLDAISSDDESFGPGPGPATANESPKKMPGNRGANSSPPPPGGEKSKHTQHLPTPKELSFQAAMIAQERYKWEKFRCLLEIQLKKLRDETETYETNPEKHPDYPDEWKQFWNRRYKQLQEEKKVDPNHYDYKPEWIAYWKDRRIELFNIAVNKIKKELKEKFKLGDDDEGKTKELMERYRIRVSSPREPSVASNRRKPPPRNTGRQAVGGPATVEAVINISDDEVSQTTSRNRPVYRRSGSRSISPKRGGGRRLGRRSRSRSPRRYFRRGSSRSRSRSRSMRRRSRSPVYHRRRGGRHSRDNSPSITSREYADRRSFDRERSSEFYRGGVGDGYSRPPRSYEHVESFRVMDSRVYPEYSVPKVRSRSASTTKDKEPAELVEEGPLTVVSVLRMLSAVEDHLGSLGPKALNLLSKALAMEMVQPNAADQLLHNEDNCVFLETTKEKLKGILIAEVLDDPQKVRVVKKLITNIAAIIFQVNSRGNESSDANAKAGNEAKALSSALQLPFDRNVLAPKLASALVIKGYFDVTTDDMTKLLHFFGLLAKTDKQRREVYKDRLDFDEVRARLGLSRESKSAKGTGPTASGEAESTPIGIDLDELMKEVENQLHKESGETASGGAGKTNEFSGSNGMMESLTDSDLQTLLQNFKFLSSEEQVHLIGHLKKLEVQEPTRVERLRKFVNLAELSGDGESCSDFLSRVVAKTGADKSSASSSLRGGALTGGGSSSGASAASVSLSSLTARRRSSERESGSRDLANLPINKPRSVGRGSPSFVIDDDEDDDDDDYNFDDLVMKACDTNGSAAGGNKAGTPAVATTDSSTNSLAFKPAAPKISLADTESIIANLMGTLSKGTGSQGGSHSGSGSGLGSVDRGGSVRNFNMINPHQSVQTGNQQQQQPHPHPQLQHHQQQQIQHPQFVNPNQGYPTQQMSAAPDQNPYGNQQGYGGYHYAGASGMQPQFHGVPHTGYGGPGINPWASNDPMQQQAPYNSMPQTYMQQQGHYNNVYGGRH